MEKELLELMIGTDRIPERCIICAGTTKEEWIGRILKIFESHEKIACRGLGCFYIVRYRGRRILLAFNVWGSPASLALTDMLTKSGAKELVFIGWTGGFVNEVGEFVLPAKTYCADGITTLIRPGMEFVYPSKKLSGRIKKHFRKNQIRHSEGTTFCTPSAYQDVFRHFQKKIRHIKPISIEMELSPFFFISNRNKASAAAILIVSDNSKNKLNSRASKKPAKVLEKLRAESQKKAIRCAAEILTEKP
jgi:purine-nucleoside phosphorylase